MNDLEQIAATLAKPGPSQETTAAGRARLARETRAPRTRPWIEAGRSRVRIFAWTSGAITAGATAAAVLMTLTSVGATKAADASARPVLMAAASTAETTPAATGKYWHTVVDTVVKGKANGKDVTPWVSGSSLWAARDGRAWHSGTENGKPTPLKRTWKFGLCDKEVGFDQIEALPSTPDALRASMTEAMKHNDDGPVPAAYQDDFVTGCMIDLLYSLPAPAKIRAAAFRSLAAMPHSEKLGTRTDHLGRVGEALSITNGDTRTLLIINPHTATVLEFDRTVSGAKSIDQRTTVRTTGWTNTLG
jgi:hypothetical protein